MLSQTKGIFRKPHGQTMYKNGVNTVPIQSIHAKRKTAAQINSILCEYNANENVLTQYDNGTDTIQYPVGR